MAIAACHATSHAEATDCLVVNLNNGQKVCYVLAETPTATFQASNLHIESSTLTDDYDLASVSHFTFENCDPNSIIDINAGNRRITVTDTEVMLEGFTPGAHVSVTDIKGCTLASQTIDSNGLAVVKTASLATGVYIIATTDGKSFKIYKK